MKKLLFIILLLGCWTNLFSQQVIQTYTDRCTNVVYTFAVPYNGKAVVTFYNKSRVFTAQEFTNGTLHAWLEQTYAWWNALSPCSTTTTGATATTNTTQQTAQNAANAASNATQNTTQNATSSTAGSAASNQTSQNTNQNTTSSNNNTSSTDTGNTGTDTSSQGSGSTSTGGSESSSTGTESSGSTSDSSQTSSSESSEGSSGSSSSEGSSSDNSDQGSSEESSGGDVENDSNDSSEGSGESSEEKKEETKEETKEEKKEEEKKEEQKDEEKSDEESDESKEEDSEEEKDEEKSDDEESEDDEEEDTKEESDDEDEEEDKKDKKKKRNLAPPVVTANLMSQQMPTGDYSRAATFGISQSSLLGTETYGATAMVYDNLQQFMLNLNYSKVHIQTKDVTQIIHGTHSHYGEGKEVTSNDTIVRPVSRVNRVYSGSIGAMKMFSTFMFMTNHSIIWLGEKGSSTGLSLGLSSTSLETNINGGYVYYDDVVIGSSLTGFWTKSFQYNPRLLFSPMIAVSSPFASYSVFTEDGFNWNTDVMFVGGSNFTYNITQRFGVNFGVTLIDSTIENFPTMKTFTIGGRLAF